MSRRPRTVNDTNRDGRVRRACGERVYAVSACGERVYAASACGERRGLRDTRVSGRASGRATVEEVPFDEGGFWLDLADLARAAKDRRGGEMRGENYRSTGGVREASANARGAGRASQHPGRSGLGPHTPVQ